MAGFLYKGILLQQHKEPALSRDLREFFNADAVAIQMAREPVGRPDELTPAEIIEIAREARIVDERDGKPLVAKLNRYRGRAPQLVVADAIDDEPYISSQLNPMLKNQKLSAVGLELAKRAIGAKAACFAVYKNLTDLDIKIPKNIGEFPVRRIRGRYPAEYQASKIYASGHGVLVIGVGAILHLARAVIFNKPQSTTFVTVAGNCVGNPTNLEVSLGMTVSQVLERCGLVEDPGRIIIGGSMTGISVIDTEHTLINPTTRAVLAFRDEGRDLGFSCIGCSRCVHVCPEGLDPFFLYRSVKRRRYEDFRLLDAQMCIGCGTCSYMCPAKLDLAGTIRAGAQEFRHMTGSMRAGSVISAKRETEQFEEYMAGYYADKADRAEARAAFRAAVRRNTDKIRDAVQQSIEKRRAAALLKAEEKQLSEEAARLAAEKRALEEALDECFGGAEDESPAEESDSEVIELGTAAEAAEASHEEETYSEVIELGTAAEAVEASPGEETYSEVVELGTAAAAVTEALPETDAVPVAPDVPLSAALPDTEAVPVSAALPHTEVVPVSVSGDLPPVIEDVGDTLRGWRKNDEAVRREGTKK